MKGKAKKFLARVKYNLQCLKLAPNAALYKDEAEASRDIIARLKAQNRILLEQYHTQAKTISRLLEMTK